MSLESVLRTLVTMVGKEPPYVMEDYGGIEKRDELEVITKSEYRRIAEENKVNPCP